MSKITTKTIENMIFIVRGKKVMLDSDLAQLYEVETKVLNQAVLRNLKRFPEDFMLQLNKEEFDILRSQIVTSKIGRGGRRYFPRVFTEQGVAMLSTVLKSEKAILVNISIMRTFVKLRELLNSEESLSERISKIEKGTDRVFRIVFERLDKLEMEIPNLPPNRKKIGLK